MLEFIRKQMRVMISSGTVYYTLYSMEREELLESTDIGKKKVFKATKKGLHKTRLLMDAKAVSSFFANIATK